MDEIWCAIGPCCSYGCLWARISFPNSKVHGANMAPTWVLTAPDGVHVGHMNLAIIVAILPKFELSGDNEE